MSNYHRIGTSRSSTDSRASNAFFVGGRGGLHVGGRFSATELASESGFDMAELTQHSHSLKYCKKVLRDGKSKASMLS